MAGGRPSKYKPEFPDALIEHMRDGNTYETFAAKIGVCDDTLREWEKVHPEFSVAKKRGWMLSMAWWENKLKENLVTSKGNTFNVAGWIYTMKCRFPKYWREEVVVIEEKPKRMLAYERKRKDVD